jgi:hypothetical protein
MMIITLIMEVVNISETSGYFHEISWSNIPEVCHLHIRRLENLKCHSFLHIDDLKSTYGGCCMKRLQTSGGYLLAYCDNCL